MVKRKRGVFGPEVGSRLSIFVDDLNMPQKEKYGAQPPIEILRQFMDHSGWYNRKENIFRELVDIKFMAAMGPPGGGRQFITQRFIRHFNVLNFVPFSTKSLSTIFGTIMDWFLGRGFNEEVKSLGTDVVDSTISVYHTVSKFLLPTPMKSHYTFNLRDVSKVFSGILRGTPDTILHKADLVCIWVHEIQREFCDRLSTKEDLKWFVSMLDETSKVHFDMVLADLLTCNEPLMYGNYLNSEDKSYETMNDRSALRKVMNQYLEDYNASCSRPMPLILFSYAVDHISRISRIIQDPGGNALLIGVGGSGRKSLCTLATYIAKYELITINMSKSYDLDDWREDLKRVYNLAGLENQPVVFLFDDTQIIHEAMLEDLSGILNTGEVANLLGPDEMSVMIERLSLDAISFGINPSSASEMYEFYISRCKSNMHVVLAMSPIGDQFRRRLLMFPALVNCSTLDWFTEWPEDALRSVATEFLGTCDLDDHNKEGVSESCIKMQQEVCRLSQVFFTEMGRHNYATPTSYLMLLNTFKKLLNMQRAEVWEKKVRYDNGLEKIDDTQRQVDKMKKELIDLQPKLDTAKCNTDQLLKKIAVDTKTANESKIVVEKEEIVCNKHAEEASSIASSCEADLQEAMPALESALKALKSLSKGDIVVSQST